MMKDHCFLGRSVGFKGLRLRGLGVESLGLGAQEGVRGEA